MAENLILSDLTKPGKTALNIVLNDDVVAERTESIEADVFWRFEDEPTATPERLGSAAAGKSLSVPFDMSHGRAIRLFLVSKTAEGNFSAQNVLEAVQTVFDPNGNTPGVGMPPSNLTGNEFTAGEAELSWTNNGGTGDNKIERKKGASGTYVVIASVSSSTDTYSASPVAIAGIYYFRIYNDDVSGYSNEVIIALTP
jgi:hypothetical protein